MFFSKDDLAVIVECCTEKDGLLLRLQKNFGIRNGTTEKKHFNQMNKLNREYIIYIIRFLTHLTHRSIYKYLDGGLPFLSIDRMRASQTPLY